jgi:Co/Zn/Cd efflux system component
MSIGASIFLIALGAVLYWAITVRSIGPVEIDVIGIILMIAGAIGLLFSLFYVGVMAPRRRAERDVVRERELP